MSDEVAAEQAGTVEQGAPEQQAGTVTPDATGQQAVKTFTQAELDAIVKERLERERKKAETAAQKAAQDAEAKALREQGEYKTLFEKVQADLAAERERAKALELAGLRRDVASKVGLPVALVDRLRGETEEELTADAQQLLAAMPKPAAPNINAAASTAAVRQPELAGIDIDNLAARLGISAKYAKEFLSNGGK